MAAILKFLNTSAKNLRLEFIEKLPFLSVKLKISVLSAILNCYFASSLARLFRNEQIRGLVFFHACMRCWYPQVESEEEEGYKIEK